MLAKTFDLLRSASETVKERTHAEPQHGTKTATPGNLFSSLSMEDTTADSGTSSEPPTDLPSVDIDFNGTEIGDEFSFTIEIFLEDVWCVWQYVREFWIAYRECQLENIVASLFTNAAIDMIRLAE